MKTPISHWMRNWIGKCHFGAIELNLLYLESMNLTYFFCCCWCVQGPFVHKDHRCGKAVPSKPGSGPHTEPNRLLPHEHPHHTPLHLLVPAWRE